MPNCVLPVRPSVLRPNSTPTERTVNYLAHLFRGFQAEFRIRQQVADYNRALDGGDPPPSGKAMKTLVVATSVVTAAFFLYKWYKHN